MFDIFNQIRIRKEVKMIKHFIGTEKAIKSKRKVEFIIKIISTPIWLPFYLIMMSCYWISTFLEDTLFYIFDDILDTVSSFIARKFFNK